MEQYDKVWGYFKPNRVDDLKFGTEKYIGKILLWEVLWTIEEGPYTGELAIGIHNPIKQLGEMPPFIWVPSSEFVNLSLDD